MAQASTCLAASAAPAFFFRGPRAGRPFGASCGASCGASSLPLASSAFFSSSAGLAASGSCAASQGVGVTQSGHLGRYCHTTRVSLFSCSRPGSHDALGCETHSTGILLYTFCTLPLDAFVHSQIMYADKLKASLGRCASKLNRQGVQHYSAATPPAEHAAMKAPKTLIHKVDMCLGGTGPCQAREQLDVSRRRT